MTPADRDTADYGGGRSPDTAPGTAAAPQDQVGDLTRLQAATDRLKSHVDDRWVQVADRVVTRSLTATRRSPPVRAAHPSAGQGAAPGALPDANPGAGPGVGELFVSEQVLIAQIRRAIAPVPGAAPSQISVHTDPDRRCAGVTISVTVRYPDPIIPIADQIRTRAQAVLGQILGAGPAATPVPTVQVGSMHVHVADVTTHDPHTGRPGPDR